MFVIDGQLTVVVHKPLVATPIPAGDNCLTVVVVDKPSVVVAESYAVAVELLAMIADKPSAVEPMHNLDNCLSEPMFDAEKPSAMVADKSSAVEPMHNIDNRLPEPMFDALTVLFAVLARLLVQLIIACFKACSNIFVGKFMMIMSGPTMRAKRCVDAKINTLESEGKCSPSTESRPSAPVNLTC